MDPWVITPTERARHEDQFRSLGPNHMGMVTGAQARNFMLQSGLQPMVLAQVWGLADMNGDGQMDINEFSVACKLITNKLKGLELPKTVPPSMIQMMPPVMQQQQGMMRMGVAAPMGMGMMPQTSMAPPQGMMGMGQPGMMGMGMMPQTSMAPQAMMGMGQPGMMGMAPMTSMSSMMPMVSSAAGMMPATSMAPGMMPVTSMAPGMMPSASMAPGMMPMAPPVPTSVPIATPGSGSGTPATAVSMDWAIPQHTRQKYMATFQNTDRGRTGFLAGVQARNILLQSGLPQTILAQIWGLSDFDNDGRLSTEEFVLAGHLCELASKGEPMPATLPPNLIPPSMRQAGPGTPIMTATAGTPTSFEDKRKENFNKGQEVLEKRRQSLIEEQKKIEEERKRKEKEEAEAREKQKREAERRRQAEIERQLQRQREAEEQRRQAEEKRLAAREEMERQRMKEWEETRKEELRQHRIREDEKVLTLKARQEHLTKDLEEMREKVKELTTNISDTRTGVTEVKTFIDGMRSSRDTKMADMHALKAQIKDQNERLLKVSQEKARMEAKNKARQAKVEEGVENELTEFEIKKKEKEARVAELREKLAALKEKEEDTKSRFEAEKNALNEHREQLVKIIETCKSLYSEFDDKRREIKAEKTKRIRELTDPDHAWDAVPEKNSDAPAATQVAKESSEEYLQYRAVYDYESENPDDLKFKAGDIIIVNPSQPHEPGWLGGELNGVVGWFPEAYAEPVTGDAPAAEVEAVSVERYVSLFPYASDEPGDLTFEAGVEIVVLKKEAEWWTGQIDDRVGVFPYNYVELVGSAPEAAPVAALEASNGDLPENGPPSDFGSSSDSDESEGKSGKKPELATVIAPYTASGKEQLTLQKGQMILVRKKTDTGWWQGEIQASGTGTKGRKRQIGWFPASYVKLMGGSEKAAAPAAPAPEEPQQPKFRALYSYAGQHDDELAFNAGDMIILLSKEEEAWWKGELDGRVGVFPSNYVEEINFEDSSNYDEVTTEDIEDVDPSAKEDDYDWNAGFDIKAEQEVITMQDRYDEVCGDDDDSLDFNDNTQHEIVESNVAFNQKRYEVISELVSTEKDYLESLEIISDCFIRPMKQKNILMPDEMEIIFTNTNDLLLCSNRLYKSLKIRRAMTMKQDVNIGDILCENFPQMGAYVRYCSSQLNAAGLLQKLVEIKPGFDEALRHCQSKQRVKGLPLSFFLIKPVKRVMDYPVLIEKILKHTDVNHPDYLLMSKALKLSRSLCEQVNEGTRHKENTERLEWLQIHVDSAKNPALTLDEKLTFNSTTNVMGPRKFLHYGLLLKAKSGKEIVAFLFNDFLLLTTPDQSVSPHFSFEKHNHIKMTLYRKPIFLDEISVVGSLQSKHRKKSSIMKADTPTEDIEFGLEFLTDNHNKDVKKVFFECQSIHDRRLWIQKLNEAIAKYQDTLQMEALRKQSADIMAPNKGVLRLVLLSASNLKCPRGKGKIDPYCEVSMGSQEYKTSVIDNTCNPKWNANMQFFIQDPSEDVLCVTVFDKDYFSPNEFLGRTEVRIAAILAEKQNSASAGPMTKKLTLLETESGMVTVRLDLQLFANN